jgi:glycolate oxidase iron-sulfur subunit
MLVRPEFFDSLMEWGSRLQGFFVKPADQLLGTSCGRLLSPLGDRHFKALAPTPFHQMVKPMNTSAGASGLKVAFFVGCVIDKVFPNIGESVMRTMEHHGVGVYLPEDFACCGIPALSSGDTLAFDRLVRHNLQRFTPQSVDVLVTACATCTSTIKKLWPLMAQELSSEAREQVTAIAAKTMEISQFLVDEVGIGPLNCESNEEEVLLTYHDPCHLKKSLGVTAQPRALLKANPKVRLKEMLEADRCCGMGGSFNLQHYEISAAIGKRKRENIVQSGCEIVATSCPACMLQLSDMLSQAGDRILVKHAVEVYAESLG